MESLLSFLSFPAMVAAEPQDDGENVTMLITVAATVGVVAVGNLAFRRCSSKKTVVDEDAVVDNTPISEEENLIPITDKGYTMEEIEKHNREGDCWIIIKDKVYDATSYLEKHPGGAYAIIQFGGQDATEDYKEIHSTQADKLLARHQIGFVKKETGSNKS